MYHCIYILYFVAFRIIAKPGQVSSSAFRNIARKTEGIRLLNTLGWKVRLVVTHFLNTPLF